MRERCSGHQLKVKRACKSVRVVTVTQGMDRRACKPVCVVTVTQGIDRRIHKPVYITVTTSNHYCNSGVLRTMEPISD